MHAVLLMIMTLSTALAHSPEVLLIHGSPGSKATWSKVMNSEIKDQFTLIAPDRPGYGDCKKCSAEKSLEVQAKEFAKLIEKDAIVVGFSYGGAVAVKLALLHPDKVRGLLLLAPALNPALEKLKWWQSPAYLRFIRDRLPSDARVSMEESIALPDELAKLDLSQIRIPVHYVQGRNDRTVSVKSAAYVEKNFTGTAVEFLWLERIDHNLPEKAPEVITKIIGEM